MYQTPPPAPQRGLTCPHCGKAAAESWAKWMPTCQSCGAEINITVPAWMIVLILVGFLFYAMVMFIVVELIALAGITPVLSIAVVIAMIALWAWIVMQIMRRWGRVVV